MRMTPEEAVENLATLNYQIKIGNKLSIKDIRYVIAISNKHTVNRNTLLHIMAQNPKYEPTDCIDATEIILKFNKQVLERCNLKGYTPLCTALTRELEKRDEISINHIKHIDFIHFLIKSGANCFTVLNFPILHEKLAFMLRYKDCFFYAITNLFLDSGVSNAHKDLYKWQLIRGSAAKRESVWWCINDAMESYFKNKESVLYSQFTNSVCRLYRVRNQAECSTNSIMSQVCAVNAIAFNRAFNILHFLVAVQAEENEMRIIQHLTIKIISIIDINKTSSKGESVLHIAAANGNYIICKYLLRCEDINKSTLNKAGQTHLHSAIFSLNAKVIQLFIDNGYNVNAPNCNFSALHTAVHKESYAIIKLLLENGAKIDAKNCEGNTPIDCAILYGASVKIKKLLFEYAQYQQLQSDTNKICCVAL